MTITNQDIRRLVGRTALGPRGEKLGKITDVYLDEQTNRPEWLVVNTGLLGTRISFVPVEAASAEGGEVRLPYSKHQIEAAPNAEADGQLSMEEEARLYAHYGLAYSDAPSASGLPTARAREGGTDDALTRSEEELRVGKTTREAGRVRLQVGGDQDGLYRGAGRPGGGADRARTDHRGQRRSRHVRPGALGEHP